MAARLGEPADRKRVTVIMDADQQGRSAAVRIAEHLVDYAQADIVDLAPHRTDGYDLSDWLRDNPIVEFGNQQCADGGLMRATWGTKRP